MNLLVIGVLHCLPVLSAATADGAEIEVLRSYFDASLRQRSAQLGTQMKASIDASLPKLEKRSHLSVLRSISNQGRVSYEVLTSSGDKTVRQEVISRYLTADSEPRETTVDARLVGRAELRIEFSRFNPIKEECER